MRSAGSEVAPLVDRLSPERRQEHQTAVRRLLDLLADDSAVDPSEYVRLLRTVGRIEPQVIIQLGTESYSFGLKQVFEGEGLGGLAEVALVGATILDACGMHEEAIARLQQAAIMASGDPGTRSSLLCSQAILEAFAGRVGEARRLAREASANPASLSVVAKSDLATISGVVLDVVDLEERRYLLDEVREVGADPAASVLMIQLAAGLAARGDIDGARAAVAELFGYALETGHRARQIDAEVAELGLEARRRLSVCGSELLDEAESLMHNSPLWRSLISTYRQAVLRQDAPRAADSYSRLKQHYDWVNGGFRSAFEGLAAFAQAMDGADVEVLTPGPPTIMSLPNVLASAEAAAVGGTLSSAADWLAWLDAELPAAFVTSVEWPACRWRVEALLWLRLGDQERASELLLQSIQACAARADTIEAEIGRAQLSTLTGDAPAQESASQRLADSGIDSAHFISAVSRICGRAARAGVRLTLQEARVLGGVAAGLTQREIDGKLGLGTRGSARAITSSYAKLGVRGRTRAAQVARERLIA